MAGLGDLEHVRRTRGVANGDVHEEVPAVLSQVRNEQVGSLPVVIVRHPEHRELPVVHSQACGVRQRLDVGLDRIVPVRQQGFEFWTGPQVVGVGPVDDLVFPATASGGELVEGEDFRNVSILVVLGHCEQPRACKQPVIAENASLVDRRAVSFDVVLEPIHTAFGPLNCPTQRNNGYGIRNLRLNFFAA